MRPPTWDMLICSIPHRDKTMRELLAVLDPQVRAQPGAAARIYRDNLEAGYGEKCQALLESSGADYVSFIDDDDLLAPDGVERVMAALRERPDYVGFPVLWTVHGEVQRPVEHSLRHDGWVDRSDMLVRDITQFNPIRRELALLGKWEGGWQAERRWGDQVRRTGLVRTEAWIPDPVYYYRGDPDDTFMIYREVFYAEDIPPMPRYPWLTAIGPEAE